MRSRDLYLIYKLEPNASVRISDKDHMRLFYMAYQINTTNCSGLSTILKTSAEKIF